MANNDLSFLIRTVTSLEQAGLTTWVFGGWAEQLRGLRAPGPHRDIDLLYPSPSFERLDSHIVTGWAQDIPQKRFSHKRAVEHEGIRIEFFLLELDKNSHVTCFFDGRLVYQWPADTLLSPMVAAEACHLRVASATALADYRRVHPQVMAASRVRAQTTISD